MKDLIYIHFFYRQDLIYIHCYGSYFNVPFDKKLCRFPFFVQDYGKCPITGEPLTMDDIVPIQTGKVCFILMFVFCCFFGYAFVIDFSGFIIVNAKTMLMFTLIGL